MRRISATRRASRRRRTLRPRAFASSPIEDEELIERVRATAKRAGALVNVADRPKLSDFIMPSIVDRSPLVIAVSTGGASPILGRMLKARLETLIPSAYGRLAELVSGFRGQRRDSDPLPDHAPPVLGGCARRPDRGSRARGQRGGGEGPSCAEIERWAEERPSPRGEVYLVGAGPGDPGPRHLSRLPPDAEGRRGALRPPRRPARS